jgi:2-hydroxychromene-2-carboxylate isomerase
MRIELAAHRLGVGVAWRPFLLGPIFRALGMERSPFVAQKEKGLYVQQDMMRQCAKYGLAPWARPTVFPRVSVLPARIALLGANQPWIAAFCREVMLLNFVRDEDINQPEQLTPILTALGLPADDVLAQAHSEQVKSRLRQQTEEARAKGLFGAPTFFVGREMFWGNDRLEDALSFAQAQNPIPAKVP